MRICELMRNEAFAISGTYLRVTYKGKPKRSMKSAVALMSISVDGYPWCDFDEILWLDGGGTIVWHMALSAVIAHELGLLYCVRCHTVCQEYCHEGTYHESSYYKYFLSLFTEVLQ